MEGVQWRFTKQLNGLRDLSYGERVQILNCGSFKLRHIKTDLTTNFKIIREFTDLDISIFLQFLLSLEQEENLKLSGKS